MFKQQLLTLNLLLGIFTFTTHAQNSVYASVTPDHLNVRAEPNGEIIGQLLKDDQVEILGREDTYGNGGTWVFIRHINSNLSGWVYRSYLNIPQDLRFVPIIWHDAWTFAAPVQTQGVILAHKFCYHYQNPFITRIQLEPKLDASLINEVPCHTLLAVYGRAEETTPNLQLWLYVKTVDGSMSGWTTDGTLAFPNYFDPQELPILSPVQNPDLGNVPLREPISSLAAVTVNRSALRLQSTTHVDFIYVVPSGTPIVLTGRNANSRFFKTTVDGHAGWIHFQNLEIEGDPNRLPVLSLKGSPSDHFSD